MLVVALSAVAPSALAAPVTTGERVLVVPFDNVNREGRLYWLSEASAVLVTDGLRLPAGEAIGRDERVRAFDRLQLPAAASLTEATVIRVAQLVGAAYVVIGSFTASGNDLTVRARLIRLDSGRLDADVTESGRLDDLYRVFSTLAGKLLPRSATATSATATFGREPLGVFENYIKGLVAESPAARIRFLNQALAASHGFDAARLALWQVYTTEGDHTRAANAAAAVPAASPFSRRARFLVAWSRIQLKQYDEAFGLLKTLADEAPNAAVFNNLGIVQSRRGSTPSTGKATYYFTKAVEASQNDPDLAFNLGYAYWMDRDPQACIYWLKEAVRRRPTDGEAHFVLGVALQASGAAIEGERERELARQLSSTYRERERRSASADLVPKNLERLSDDLETGRATLVDVALAAGEQKDQEELAAFHLERARRLVAQQLDREAVSELQRSLYLSPYQADVLLLLGRLHLRAGRVQEAIGALKVSLWSRDGLAAHVALGEAYLAAGDRLQARTEADRALALDPTSADARALREKVGPK